jgi:hypothetical protein
MKPPQIEINCLDFPKGDSPPRCYLFLMATPKSKLRLARAVTFEIGHSSRFGFRLPQCAYSKSNGPITILLDCSGACSLSTS